MEYFLYYQYAVTSLLAVILFNFIINNICYRSPSNHGLPGDILIRRPLVSILIPARDEEDNIGRCLRSLTKQDYQRLEILVLDDGSRDRTASMVQEWSGKDRRIRLICGKPLTPGWKGKSYACHQLACQARGEYLIFTDADTLHFPDSVSSSIAALHANRLDALSIFPGQIMVSIHERLVVIFINLAVLALMPLSLIRKTGSPGISIANGQFMLFKKKTYEAIGGHRNIRKDIIEDVAISRQVKKCGFRFMVFDGRQTIRCRMYKGFRDVVWGFSRFIFSAMNYSLTALAVVIMMVLILFFFPLVFLPLGLFISNWPFMVNINILIQVSVILIIRIMMTFRFRTRLIDIFLHPLSMVYIAVLSVNSVFQAKYGRGIYWKERYYGLEDEEEIESSKPDI